MRKIINILMALSIVLGGAFSQAQGQMTCPGSLASFLQAGMRAQVSPGVANRLRDNPGVTGTNVIGALAAGEIVTVLSGPQCQDNFAWYQVQTRTGQTGWTAQGDNLTYWLLAVESSVEAQTVPGTADYGMDNLRDVIEIDPILIGGLIESRTVQPTDEIMGWIIPQNIELLINLPDAQRVGRLEVYPVAGMEASDVTYLQQIILQRDPNLTSIELPFVIGAAQLYITKVSYVPFVDGLGVRFIAQYAHDVWPSMSYSLVLYYGGLTSDGRYYVLAGIPLRVPSLPDDLLYDAFDYDTFFQYFDEYVADVRMRLDQLSDDDFDPMLASLDAVLGTISTRGTAIVAQPSLELVRTGAYFSQDSRLNTLAFTYPPEWYITDELETAAVILVGNQARDLEEVDFSPGEVSYALFPISTLEALDTGWGQTPEEILRAWLSFDFELDVNLAQPYITASGQRAARAEAKRATDEVLLNVIEQPAGFVLVYASGAPGALQKNQQALIDLLESVQYYGISQVADSE